MSKSIESLVSFSAGEWSPTMAGRVDQAKYRSACLQARNMLVLKTGPGTRRPGTENIAPCKLISGGDFCARGEDFQFSVNTKFVLEWGHYYVRFFSNGAQVTLDSAPIWTTLTNYQSGSFVEDPGDANAIYYSARGINGGTVQPHLDAANWVKQSIYEVPTPYTALLQAAVWVSGITYPAGSFVRDPVNGSTYYTYFGIVGGVTPPRSDSTHWFIQDPTVGDGLLADTEVYQLKFAPINDVIYICHKNHPRASLTRFGDTNWVYAEVVDLTPPLLDQNASDTTVALSAPSGANGTVTMAFDAPIWVTARSYAIGNSVKQGGFIYNCIVAHISGTFATDLAAGKWEKNVVFVDHPLGTPDPLLGSYWEIAYLRPSAYVEYTGVAATGFAAGTSDTIVAFGAWEVHTYGVWSADIAIQASTDNGLTWQTVRTVTGRGDRNVDITGTAVVAQLYRIVVSNVAVPAVPGSVNPRVVFECVDSFLFGIVRVTQVLGNYSAKVNVITPLPLNNAWVSGKAYLAGDLTSFNGQNYTAINNVTSGTNPSADPTNWASGCTPTIFWSEGAWSNYRGFPAAITVFQQRVWCGFSDYQPQHVWGTKVGEIENWDLGDGTEATDGVSFDLDAVGDGAILWMQAQDALFIGMVEAEWILAQADATNVIGPTNIAAHRQSRWGSNANINAIVVGDALLFAQRQAFSIRQMLFSIATNKYMSQDLTALSDQVLNGGAVQLAYQKQGNKNGFVWATTLNGELVGMTYELDQEVFGWHRHFTGLGIDAGFESVCCIQGSGSNDDEVWVVVNRKIGGVAARFMERLNPINWQTIVPQTARTPGYGADKDQAYYVDCGITVIDPPSPVVGGLSYLEGRTVIGSVNGVALPPVVVSGGQADFTDSGYQPAAGDILQVGLPFKSTIQPMNLDVDVHTGVTQGLKKKVTGLCIQLLNTLACIATDGSFRVYVNDGKLVVGTTYTIVYAGSTDFTALGAANNDVGTVFIATGSGSGDGTGRVGTQPRQNELIFRRAAAPFDPVPLFSGPYEVKDFAGEYSLTVPVILYTEGPLPLTVAGVSIAYNISGTP